MRIHEARLEASLPKRPGSLPSPIHVLRIALRHILHEARASIVVGRREQNVHVIGHEDVAVHGATAFRHEFLQQPHVHAEIAVFAEAGLAIDTAMPNVQRDARKAGTSATSHARLTRQGDLR
jgi:hypothetical protein